jgi:hypothetical protein
VKSMRGRRSWAGTVARLCGVAMGGVLLLGLAPALMGCSGPKPLNVDGTWRSEKGLVLTVRLLPDGTLEMTDRRGVKHPFRRVGPERWEARISRVAQGTVYREGDQLVFRREPTEEAKKPLIEKDGLILTRKINAVEERMTRVPDPETPAGKP